MAVDDTQAASARHPGSIRSSTAACTIATRILGVALLLAYNAYYTNRSVLSTIEERCGYEARPPQPRGYPHESFDDSLLARIREREPFWRPAD